MKLNANEIVTLATIRSNRNLLAVSSLSVFLASERAELSGTWSFFGQRMTTDLIIEYSAFVIVFFAIGHIILWLGDYRSFTLWFAENNVSLNEFDRVLEQDPLKAALKQVQGFQGTVANFTRLATEARELIEAKAADADEDRNRLKKLEELGENMARSLEGNIRVLESIGSRNKELGTWAKVHLFGWYLLVPLGLAVLALVLLSLPAPTGAT